MTWNSRYQRNVTVSTSVVQVPFEIYCKGLFSVFFIDIYGLQTFFLFIGESVIT